MGHSMDTIARGDPTAEEPEQKLDGGKSSKMGSFELKTIRGHGPYLYLRYWDGKRHRSKYLGKWKPGETLGYKDENNGVP